MPVHPTLLGPLSKGGAVWAWRPEASAEQRKEGGRLFNAALAPLGVAADGKTIEAEDQWFEILKEILAGQRRLTGDFQAAFERIDGPLSKARAFEVMRLQIQGASLIDSAWEARGDGLAHTVTEEGWRKMGERLAKAKEVLTRSWDLRPGGRQTPNLMLVLVKGLDGDRDEMELWFRRAMEADGDNAQACSLKMDYLDPKWHGSREEVLAFGRECRKTKSWKAGITLLAADAHLRVAGQLRGEEYTNYLKRPEVREDIDSDFK